MRDGHVFIGPRDKSNNPSLWVVFGNLKMTQQIADDFSNAMLFCSIIMKKYILLLTSIIIANIALSQCNGRYQTEIFNSVSVNTVNYSDVYDDNEHKMDIYTPDGDTETNRPVILYMHGGSFTAGNKNTTVLGGGEREKVWKILNSRF